VRDGAAARPDRRSDSARPAPCRAEFLNTNGEHEHDTSVSSVSITVDDELVDFGLFDEWTTGILRNKGTDMYRMKVPAGRRMALGTVAAQ